MQQQISIDLSKTRPLKCTGSFGLLGLEMCGCEEFESVTFLRVLPALLSPTMKDEIIPVPAYRCVRCKKIADLTQTKPEKMQ